MLLARRKSSGRSIEITALLLAAIGSAGCQIVFGLDDYTTFTEPTCPELAPPNVDSGGSGLRGIRRIDALSVDGVAELTPSAYCPTADCFLFYHKRTTSDQLMCSHCKDLAALDCAAPVVVGLSGFRNPSVRGGTNPELWFVNGQSQIQHATLDASGSCTIGVPKPVLTSFGPGSWPVVSPNGKVLLYTWDFPSRIYISKIDGTGTFTKPVVLGGIHNNADLTAQDLRPMPVWLDDNEAFDTIYFTSTRLGGTPSSLDEGDVFVAHRSVNMPFDAPFDDAQLVEQLSGPGTDFPPARVFPTQWLWSFGKATNLPDSDLYLIDVGLSPLFDPPLRQPFANVNTGNEGEDAPALDASHLFFAKTQGGGPSRLFTASISTADGISVPASVADLGTPTDAIERDPFPLPDGRLLFVSTRSGVPKIWIKTPGEAGATRATTAPESTAEGTPFVDGTGTLWLSWDGGSDTQSPVIARAPLVGASWGAVTEVQGLGHVPGAVDKAPRLVAGGRTLVFASTRAGGFFPGVSTIWAAQRPEASGDAWAPAFPIPELSTVNGVTGPFPSPTDCSITVASVSRLTSFSRDLASAARAPR